MIHLSLNYPYLSTKTIKFAEALLLVDDHQIYHSNVDICNGVEKACMQVGASPKWVWGPLNFI